MFKILTAAYLNSNFLCCSHAPRMDIPLLSNPDFCGPSRIPGHERSLVTLKSLLSDRALTVKREKQQPPSRIFSLPAEMLAEMFLQAIADDLDASAMLFPMHFHLVLTQVCALWRAVALHTPSLWCRVVLHIAGRKTGFDGITSLANICFQRSCELPLALVITSSVTDPLAIPNEYIQETKTQTEIYRPPADGR
jgi:hypothetical protein